MILLIISVLLRNEQLLGWRASPVIHYFHLMKEFISSSEKMTVSYALEALWEKEQHLEKLIWHASIDKTVLDYECSVLLRVSRRRGYHQVIDDIFDRFPVAFSIRKCLRTKNIAFSIRTVRIAESVVEIKDKEEHSYSFYVNNCFKPSNTKFSWVYLNLHIILCLLIKILINMNFPICICIDPVLN